jgi:hypothetical protein
MAESDPKLLLLNLFSIKGTKQGKERTILVLGVFSCVKGKDPVLDISSLVWFTAF